MRIYVQSDAKECHDRGPACPASARIPLRGRIFLRKTPLLSSRSPLDFAATPMGRSFAGDLLCQAPREGRPEAWPKDSKSRRRACEGFVQGFLRYLDISSSFNRTSSHSNGGGSKALQIGLPRLQRGSELVRNQPVFPHESRSVTARLNTQLPGFVSFRSATK